MPWVISGTEGYTPPPNYPEDPAYITPPSSNQQTLKVDPTVIAVAVAVVVLLFVRR